MKFTLLCFVLTFITYIIFEQLQTVAIKSKYKSFFKNKSNTITKKNNNLDFLNFFSKTFDNNENKINNNNYQYVNNFSKNQNNFSFKSSNNNKLTIVKEDITNSGITNNAQQDNKFKYPMLDKIKDIDTKMMEKINDKSSIFEGWWTIKSPDYRNPKRFPGLALPIEENNFANIIQNEDGLRVNFAKNCTDPNKPKEDIWFYFRLSDTQIWYSSTKSDLNVLDSLELTSISAITETFVAYKSLKLYCFRTTDKQNKNWEICHFDEKTFRSWLCKIKEVLKIIDINCSSMKNKSFKIEKFTELIQPEVVIPLPSRQCNENWDYNKNGADWECVCSEGNEQSPIDLPDPKEAILSPVKPLFQYKIQGPTYDRSTLDQFQKKKGPMQIINEDGFLEIVNYDFGKVITLDGAVYRAERVTFHTPSNHKIKGKQFPLEVSVIHYGISKGDIDKQVVLNFLFEKKAGAFNIFIDDIDFLNLPNPISKTESIEKSLYIPKLLYNTTHDKKAKTFSMKPFSFYTYQGSLMFPPCTEQTIQYVASTPLPISTTIIKLFEEALRVPDLLARDPITGDISNIAISRKLPNSNRQIQKTNGRPVYFYDHTLYCLNEIEENQPVRTGHYEKLPRTAVKYVYVTGQNPSGVPGSYVVSDEEAKGTNVDEITKLLS